MTYIQVEGLRELNQAVRRSSDSDLPRRMGQAHKRVGQFIIDHLQPQPDPAAVGRGAGAVVRPSATRREVLLRAGGRHRDGTAPQSQWGKRQGRPLGRRAPKRPYIKQTAVRHLGGEIGTVYLREITRALDPAFYDTEIG